MRFGEYVLMTPEATGVQKTWDCEEAGGGVIIVSFLRKRTGLGQKKKYQVGACDIKRVSMRYDSKFNLKGMN
jgi:hypothetical protein